MKRVNGPSYKQKKHESGATINRNLTHKATTRGGVNIPVRKSRTKKSKSK